MGGTRLKMGVGRGRSCRQRESTGSSPRQRPEPWRGEEGLEEKPDRGGGVTLFSRKQGCLLNLHEQGQVE